MGGGRDGSFRLESSVMIDMSGKQEYVIIVWIDDNVEEEKMAGWYLGIYTKISVTVRHEGGGGDTLPRRIKLEYQRTAIL